MFTYYHFRSSSSKAYSGSFFGIGQGTSQDVKPNCYGDETRLAFCPMENNWNVQHCPHTKDAGVQCIPSPMGKTFM